MNSIKKATLFILLSIFCNFVANVNAQGNLGSSNNLEFVRQITIINGTSVATDLPVFNSYGILRSRPLEANATVFQLYASYMNADGIMVLPKLDEKSVGTFFPNVTISMKSEDPYLPTTTRADHPYAISLSVSGLLNGSHVPEYARSISLKRGYKLYSPLTYGPDGRSGDYVDAYQFVSNGIHTEEMVYQKLPDGAPTQAFGSESFSAFVHPNALAGNIQLANQEIIILPAGTAAIDGIESGRTYDGIPDPGVVKIVNAYPRSRVYARAYKGHPTPSATGVVIPEAVRVWDDKGSNVPKHSSMPLDLAPLAGSLLKGGGEFTIEVVAVTPFNGGEPEVLSQVSFYIDPTLRVRAMSATLE